MAYYAEVAEWMLPHLRDRPLSFQRYPNGIDRPGFFQKDRPDHYPDWITTVRVAKKGGHLDQVIADKRATLIYLANNGVVTLHGSLSTAGALNRPDRLIFDLDPSIDDFEVVKEGARATREVLESLGLVPFLQTTGSRGLHIVAPIKQEAEFSVVSDVAREIARLIVARDPDSFTIEGKKANRGDRLLIDYFRNAYAQTAVVPYSVRARPGAPVATPIEWAELETEGLSSSSFDITSVLRRLRDRGDPWTSMRHRARSLRGPAARLARAL